MEYFLNSFGDITIGNVAILLCAVIFLFGCYKKVEKYFSEKAIKEKEYDERIKKVISQAENYPKWHEQSLCIQKKFGNSIDNLDRKMDKLQNQMMREWLLLGDTEFLDLMMKFGMTISTQKNTLTRYLKILQNMRGFARTILILKIIRRLLQ